MLANYGYKDASGDFFITVNTDKCNGCGECVKICPSEIFIVSDDDPNDPMRDEPVVIISEIKKKKLKYECNPCKADVGTSNTAIPCTDVCSLDAISHSW